jgi:hypothetical protein
VGTAAGFFSSEVAAGADTSLPGLGEGFRPRVADTERALLPTDRGSESQPPGAGDRRPLTLAPDDIAGTRSTRLLLTNLLKTPLPFQNLKAIPNREALRPRKHQIGAKRAQDSTRFLRFKRPSMLPREIRQQNPSNLHPTSPALRRDSPESSIQTPGAPGPPHLKLPKAKPKTQPQQPRRNRYAASRAAAGGTHLLRDPGNGDAGGETLGGARAGWGGTRGAEPLGSRSSSKFTAAGIGGCAVEGWRALLSRVLFAVVSNIRIW